jgi:hypothetical protein
VPARGLRRSRRREPKTRHALPEQLAAGLDVRRKRPRIGVLGRAIAFQGVEQSVAVVGGAAPHVAPSIRAITHVVGKAIGSSRRAGRGAGGWLRTTMAPAAGHRYRAADLRGGRRRRRRPLTGRVAAWALRRGKGPLGHALDDQETFDSESGARSSTTSSDMSGQWCAGSSRSATARLTITSPPMTPMRSTPKSASDSATQSAASSLDRSA